MDRKSKFLTWTFILIVIAAVGWSYYNFIIERNFIVHNYAECDPTKESCFMWCEDGECEDDYYAKITKSARDIPICNEALEECEPLICELGEIGCEVIYCSEDMLDEGEICTNPSDLQLEEPVGESEDVATSTESEI